MNKGPDGRYKIFKDEDKRNEEMDKMNNVKYEKVIATTIHDTLVGDGYKINIKHQEPKDVKDATNDEIRTIMDKYAQHSKPGESYKNFLLRMGYIVESKADTRYKVPKEPPKSTYHEIFEAIQNNAIYREVQDLIGEAKYERAKETILNAQMKQVGYGLDKYPETLNGNSWTAVETIDHIIEETIDKLHYLVMLQHKLKQQEEENERKGLRPL